MVTIDSDARPSTLRRREKCLRCGTPKRRVRDERRGLDGYNATLATIGVFLLVLLIFGSEDTAILLALVSAALTFRLTRPRHAFDYHCPRCE